MYSLLSRVVDDPSGTQSPHNDFDEDMTESSRNRRFLGLELSKIFIDVFEATRRVVVRTPRVLPWIDYLRLRALSLLNDIPDNLIVTSPFSP